MDEYKEGLGALQRPGSPEACSRLRALGGGKAADPRAVTRVNWLIGSAGVEGTRGLATGEIRDLRAPHSGCSEYHTPHLQAFCDQRPSSFPGWFLEEAEIQEIFGVLSNE